MGYSVLARTGAHSESSCDDAGKRDFYCFFFLPSATSFFWDIDGWMCVSLRQYLYGSSVNVSFRSYAGFSTPAVDDHGQ